MISLEEQARIRQALMDHGPEIRIRFYQTDDGPGRAMVKFCAHLQSLVPGIRIETEKSEEGAPFFEVLENVAFQAIPLGAELQPFLKCLSGAGKEVLQTLPDPEVFSRITAPAKLTVFIAPFCPHCPQTVAALLSLAGACKNIHVRVVDGEMFAQDAADAKVRSAPTTILDHDFRWTGSVNLAEIVDAVINRDPSRLCADTLQQMIEEKSPDALSRMMLESHQIYPGFIQLLTHEKWSVRLGAMVVFEFINTASELLAHEVLDELWARFESASDDVKGDILYLYGESGRTEMIERVKQAQAASYSAPVREAAGEALAALAE